MKICCISAKAQHGKDTAAKLIKERLEYKGQRVLITHYADLLKFICVKFFGWNEVKDEAGRTLLQYIGTEIMRTFISDKIWILILSICPVLSILLMYMMQFHFLSSILTT